MRKTKKLMNQRGNQTTQPDQFQIRFVWPCKMRQFCEMRYFYQDGGPRHEGGLNTLDRTRFHGNGSKHQICKVSHQDQLPPALLPRRRKSAFKELKLSTSICQMGTDILS